MGRSGRGVLCETLPHLWSHAPGVRFLLARYRTAPIVIGQTGDPRLAETPAPASSARGRDVGAGLWLVLP